MPTTTIGPSTGPAPKDASGNPPIQGYVPGTGVIPIQLGATSVDALGFTSAGVALATPTPTTGHVVIDANTIATYGAAIIGLAPGSTPQDIFTLTGSATKVIRIMRVAISATTTSGTAITNDVVFLSRSTANTGGTSTAPTAVAFDPNDPAATATILAYTVNPTAGTLVGITSVNKLVPTLATFTVSDFPSQVPLLYQYGVTDSKPIVLRGVGSVFAVNLNGVAPTATASWDIAVEWTEANS